MAGKSKRGRRLPRSKRKGRKAYTPPAAPKSAEAQPTEPAPRDKPTPKPKAPAVTVEASNVAAELRRIGIVAGVIAVILVILALIFA
jgi:hypothetical protein